MARDGIDLSELDEFTDRLIQSSKEANKVQKKFLRDQGTKLRRKTAQRARANVQKVRVERPKYVREAGQYRNTRDNQMLFIAALNSSYFRQLAQELILDPDYANAASIDVEAQRAAWVASGKAEAADWDDDTVKATPYKRTVYLAGNVKILGSMTDLIFPINLF